MKFLDDVSDQDIVELNIPTGVPLVYELDDELRPIHETGDGGVRGRYLDPVRALASAQAVARQAG